MGHGKFGRLTSDLVRTGEAIPSDSEPAHQREDASRLLSLVASNPNPLRAKDVPAQQPTEPAPRSWHDSDLLPDGVFEQITEAAPKKHHRLVVVLTAEEYETLGILAVKKGFSRHQVLRKALDGYLEWLVDEYGTKCHCLASTCAAGCEHSRAEDELEPPTDAE